MRTSPPTRVRPRVCAEMGRCVLYNLVLPEPQLELCRGSDDTSKKDDEGNQEGEGDVVVLDALVSLRVTRRVRVSLQQVRGSQGRSPRVSSHTAHQRGQPRNRAVVLAFADVLLVCGLCLQSYLDAQSADLQLGRRGGGHKRVLRQIHFSKRRCIDVVKRPPLP